MRATLAAWKALLAGPVEVRKMRPLAVRAAGRAVARMTQDDALRIDDASFNEHGAISELLEQAGLPLPTADDGPVRMLVGRDADGLAGCVGYERYGSLALVRSLAVRSDRRRRGAGEALVRGLAGRLAAAGVERVFLLTTSASSYFQRLGFTELGRAETPSAVQGSREFQLRCCEAATVMHRRLPFD
jgi:amino-acid N-acetyltransferase